MNSVHLSHTDGKDLREPVSVTSQGMHWQEPRTQSWVRPQTQELQQETASQAVSWNNRSKHPPLWKLTAVLPRLQVWRLGLFDYFNFSNPALRISSKASELSLLTKKKKLTTPTLHIMVNNETHGIVRNLQAVKADSIGTYHRNENSRIKILSFSSVTYTYCKCRNNWLYIRKDNLLFK